MISIAVLMTCFNRIECTLRCLTALTNASNIENVNIDVYIVDDMSIDGTSDVLKANFPNVNIILGTGALYWSGGMRLAWQESAKKDYDFYLWLNNDTYIFKNSLELLVETAIKSGKKSIICSTLISEYDGKITYGGKNKKNIDKVILPSNNITECELINGNCVLIPKSVFYKIGSIDSIFTHALGDYDYSLRALRMGIKSYIAPNIIGYCEMNSSLPTWTQKEIRLIERIRSLYSPLGYVPPYEHFRYVSRHYGLFEAVKRLTINHIRMLMPWIWKKY